MNSLELKRLISIVNLMLLASIALAQHGGEHFNAIQNNWTGSYGGFNIGGIFNDVDLNSNHFGFTDPTETCNANSHFSSLFPGVQFGYLRKLNSNVVLGIEGDFTYNVDQKNKVACSCPLTPSVSDRYTIKNRVQGSIRGRLGYLFNPKILPFLSAGASFADLGASYTNEGGDYYSTNRTQPGWLVGGGLEWDFANSWTLRAEYYYINYNKMNMNIPNIYGLYDPNGNAAVNLSTNNVRVALSYWF